MKEPAPTALMEANLTIEAQAEEIINLAEKVGRLKAIALQYAAAAHRDSDLVNARRRIEDAAK